MKVVCGIYKIENAVNGKCYIGKSVDIYKRWNEHIRALDSNKHYNIHFQRAWTKYGKSQFTFDILDVCLREELSDKEQYYISKFDAFNNGYNQTLGGEGMLGHIQSQETKIKDLKLLVAKIIQCMVEKVN